MARKQIFLSVLPRLCSPAFAGRLGNRLLVRYQRGCMYHRGWRYLVRTPRCLTVTRTSRYDNRGCIVISILVFTSSEVRN